MTRQDRQADCRKLARLHRAGELVAIRVPTREEEAVRDLCRARPDMVEDLDRARKRLGAFLLRHGEVWRGGSAWTLKHEAWLRVRHFEDVAMAATFAHYRAVVEDRSATLDAIEADLAIHYARPLFEDAVARLSAYRGVARMGALTLASEVCDWRRFGRERAADTLVMAATDLHQTPEALAETLLADDHRLDVAVRLLALAAETTYADKRRALARLLKQTATGDDIQVDIAAEFARAWAELDVNHIFLLRTVRTPPPSGEVGWSNEALAQRFPTASLVLVSILNGLVQRHAIRDIAVGTWDGVAGNERWLVTDFGEQLLGQLEDDD